MSTEPLAVTQTNGSCVYCPANPQGLGRMEQCLCFPEEELELRVVRQPSWTQSGGLRSYSEDARLLFKPGVPAHWPCAFGTPRRNAWWWNPVSKRDCTMVTLAPHGEPGSLERRWSSPQTREK